MYFFYYLLFKDVKSTERKKYVQYFVNFAPEISEIISETKNFVILGYKVPSLAQLVALKQKTLIG